ncbi:translation machinery-associated protein 16 [Knufia obscura]|uniref:Translation machinery-associated protein 16 n=2 Tax=Knufia TaxID=430999 RepID=A0AAN8EDL8_9EURO|nr:translation machinery-associated protein 16 [Knufia obscura]KAK5952968.1 translation machinery-associated protein 16 [Knufia fluminis]
MARALHKVQKKISKKRGSKPTALHENSRDARRLRQAGAREDKLARIMRLAKKSNQQYVYRVAWFQDAIAEQDSPLSDVEVQQMIEQFIGREDEELAEHKAAQRPGRPRSKAEDQILNRIEAEQKEHESGFWMPELRNKDSLEKLKDWGGQWAGLNTMTFVRAHRDADIKPSSFPPKGLS